MSKVKIQGNASGSGVFTLTTPNSGTDRTITLPDASGTLAFTTDDDDKMPLAGGTFTGAVAFTDGSPSSPSITNAGDTNTGIYFPAGDNIGFATGGVARGFWSASQLNVTGNGVFSGNITVGGTVDGIDVASAGALAINSVQKSGGSVITSNLDMNDNARLKFGTSGDLQIYHDGNNSYINEEGTGILSISSNGSGIDINKGTSEYMGRFITDGAVELYHNNGKKIETASTGITVTGLQTISGSNTTAVTNGVTMWGARGLTVNSNSGAGSDNLVMGAMSDGTGRQFLAATNGAGTANYGLILNPIGGEVFISRGLGADFRIGNYGADGIRMNTDGNQAQITVETHLTSSRQLVRFTNGNGLVGAINTNGSATSYNTSSDYRLKENVDYTWDATTRLKQLKPARFNFIADDTNTLVDGFIAHEVSSVVPEAISGTKDAVEYQSIDQSKLVPLLVKTIQELEARLTAGGL